LIKSSVCALNSTDGHKILSRDFREFIESLNSNDVRYLVIGSFAMALYGKPRYTKDIGIWIDCTEANAAKLLKALSDFGFGSLQLTVDDFTTPNQVIQLGYPPHRIDLLTSAAGVDFGSCYERRTTFVLDGVDVACIDLDGLKANKRATGRLQDLADVETLDGA
jgi:hypothetical protein